MTKVETLGSDASWAQYPAEEWSDALLAAMKLGGVEHLYFVSGTEMSFFQEASAKAQALGRPAPKLMTMMHESVSLMAALGETMVSGRPAATRICSFTRSRPVTSSVTPCSTWMRVFISMK